MGHDPVKEIIFRLESARKRMDFHVRDGVILGTAFSKIETISNQDNVQRPPPKEML